MQKKAQLCVALWTSWLCGKCGCGNMPNCPEPVSFAQACILWLAGVVGLPRPVVGLLQLRPLQALKAVGLQPCSAAERNVSLVAEHAISCMCGVGINTL